jgi:hypothetical protein
MRWTAFFFAFVVSAVPGVALEIVQPAIAQSDGGTPLPAGFTHIPGEVLFLSFLADGYKRTADDKMTISYSVDAFDPKGIKIFETVSNQVVAELTPQDKEWKPKMRLEVPIPPLAPSGKYRIVIKARDEIAMTTAEKEVPFEVRGAQVAPSETLVIRNFRFLRNEDDQRPLAKAVYRPGDAVWARFEITGYKYGKDNQVDVRYGITVIAGSGKVLWSEPEAAVESSTSFYPKPYVPGAMGLNLEKDIRPGDYTIAVVARDQIGMQTYEDKYVFTIE